MNGLAKLDIEQLRMVLVIAREMVPQRFGKRDMSAVFRLLNDCQALMPVLPAAIKLGTRHFWVTKRKGQTVLALRAAGS